VIGTVLQLLKLPDGAVKVLLEGGERARITRFLISSGSQLEPDVGLNEIYRHTIATSNNDAEVVLGCSEPLLGCS